MLEYFVRNRRGSITVLLSIILIAALSLNSTLIEMAKYHSMKRLYKEVGENAAFSLLSYYDRDLYENFGFLALEQGVGEEELTRYLQMNLAGLDSGLQFNRADILANVTSADVARLYPLSQKDVYVSQMMEFNAYRAPASLVNNALNIEDMLDELKEKLAEALPFFEIFQELTGLIEAYVNAVIRLYEYYEAAVELQKAADDYIAKLGSYNASISAINDFISSYDDEPEDGNNGSDGHLDLSQTGSGKVKDENYESQLSALQDIAKENAEELRKCIEELDPILENYGEKMEAYMAAYNELLGANMEAVLATAKQRVGDIGDARMKANAQNFIDMVGENIGEGNDIFDTMQDLAGKIPGQLVEDAREKLRDQATKLSVPVADLMQLEAVEEVDPTRSIMALIIDNMLELSGVFEHMAAGLVEAIKMILDGVEAMMIAVTNGTYDPDMNHDIYGSGYYGEMVDLTLTDNPYAAEDTLAVDAKLKDSEEIAERVGYDVDLLAPGESWDASALENAMNNLLSSEKEFREACGNLKSNPLDLIGMLQSLMGLVGAMKNFVANIIVLIQVFIDITADDFVKIIYQKLFATVYATEMFSNRVTDMNGDTRLNGSSFFKESDYANADKCFVQADAEYLYSGERSEIANQQETFNSMLMFRMLCNITSVLTDEELMDILEGLVDIPIIGWIAIVVIVLVKLILEAWFDMIQMIYAKEDVDILKLDGGYFSLDGSGIDDLKEMVEKVVEEQTGVVIEPDDSGISDVIDEYGEGLFKWGYKDHLFLLMLLFTPSDKIYDRSATLIETQLQQKKAKDGAAYIFRLDEMATYIRVDTVAEYQPLLPIPVIPGLNDTGIKIRTVHYSGY